jgi:hypothetical protein
MALLYGILIVHAQTVKFEYERIFVFYCFCALYESRKKQLVHVFHKGELVAINWLVLRQHLISGLRYCNGQLVRHTF